MRLSPGMMIRGRIALDDDGGIGNSDSQALAVPPTWFSPWNYHRGPATTELSILIATDIILGADFKTACMNQAISPKKAMTWLHIGEDAYNREADGSDRDAPSLDFFLKIMQAVGYSSVKLQQQMRTEFPRWWLGRNPEQRTGWGYQTLESNTPLIPAYTLPTDDNTIEADTVDSIPAPAPLPPDGVRQMLKTLIQGGAAIGEGDVERPQRDTKLERYSPDSDQRTG